MLQTRVVVAGRPPANTDRLSSSKSDWAYTARSACSASARAFVDVRGVFAAAGGGLALVTGVLRVGVEGWKRDGIATARVLLLFSKSDSVSVDNDENACTRLGAPLSSERDGPGRAIFGIGGRRSGFRALSGSSLTEILELSEHKWRKYRRGRTGQVDHHRIQVVGCCWHGRWSDSDMVAGREESSVCAYTRCRRLNCRLTLSQRSLRCWIASSHWRIGPLSPNCCCPRSVAHGRRARVQA